MFQVEWLQGDKAIHREAMIGANLESVLKVARAEVPNVGAQYGHFPDRIRIHDARLDETSVHKAL
jgi:hypothetical protein